MKYSNQICAAILLSVLLLGPSGAPALADISASKTVSSDSAAEIKQVEAARDAWRTAMITKNEAVWRRILRDDLQYAHSGGDLEGKEKTIQQALASRATYTQIDFEDSKISIFGDTAIVTGKEVFHAAGKQAVETVIALTVWEKGKQGWQLLAKLQKKA